MRKPRFSPINEDDDYPIWQQLYVFDELCQVLPRFLFKRLGLMGRRVCNLGDLG